MEINIISIDNIHNQSKLKTLCYISMVKSQNDQIYFGTFSLRSTQLYRLRTFLKNEIRSGHWCKHIANNTTISALKLFYPNNPKISLKWRPVDNKCIGRINFLDHFYIIKH